MRSIIPGSNSPRGYFSIHLLSNISVKRVFFSLVEYHRSTLPAQKGPFYPNAPPTVRFAHDFIELYRSVESEECPARVPDTLPVYIFGGDMDPCCNYGQGLHNIASMLAGQGRRNVSVRCYKGGRHVLCADRFLRREVEQDIVDFIIRNS